jgi:hypothetical protein
MTPAEIIEELDMITTRYDEMRKSRSPDVLNVLYCRVKALAEKLKSEEDK